METSFTLMRNAECGMRNCGGETKFRILILHFIFYILLSTFYFLLSTFYFGTVISTEAESSFHFTFYFLLSTFRTSNARHYLCLPAIQNSSFKIQNYK